MFVSRVNTNPSACRLPLMPLAPRINEYIRSRQFFCCFFKNPNPNPHDPFDQNTQVGAKECPDFTAELVSSNTISGRYMAGDFLLVACATQYFTPRMTIVVM